MLTIRLSPAARRPVQLRDGWEEVLRLSTKPTLCPWTLLKTYVALTAKHCPPGGVVLRTLRPPFAALSAARIASITRALLQRFGVDTTTWGPHSTRGAGVRMYKALGLSSEQVCEIGQWKNTNAFTSHYLRLGARVAASGRILSLVHTVSLGASAEPDRSRTPEKFTLPGGSDLEGEARSHGEPTLPPIIRKVAKRGRSPPDPIVPLKFAFATSPPTTVIAKQ